MSKVPGLCVSKGDHTGVSLWLAAKLYQVRDTTSYSLKGQHFYEGNIIRYYCIMKSYTQ